MKEILCFGDSNTHGYMPGLGTRYPIDQRWSGLLGKLLGDGYHVVEEGMDGRTTAFEDDLQPWRSALGYIGPCVKTHAPLDLIIIMLGTNDSKTRYGVSAEEIGFGMQELIQRIETATMADGPAPARRSSSSARFPCPRRAATRNSTPNRCRNRPDWLRFTRLWQSSMAVPSPRQRTGSPRNSWVWTSVTSLRKHTASLRKRLRSWCISCWTDPSIRI